MSDVQIPNLPAASTLSGQEQIEVVQNGVSVRATTQQLADLGAQEDEGLFVLKAGDTMTGPLAINGGDADGLTINVPITANRSAIKVNAPGWAGVDLDGGAAGASLAFWANGVLQWDVAQAGPGTPWAVDRFNHVTGAYIDQPLMIDQYSGEVFVKDFTSTGLANLQNMEVYGSAIFDATSEFYGLASFVNVAIYAGTIDATTIGATAPTTGAFTDLRASPWITVNAADAATTSWAGMEFDTNGAAQIFGSKLSSGLGWSVNLLDPSNFTDFSISRYNSSSALIDKPITISQATGVAAFTSTPTAPTAATADSSTKLATTAFVKAQNYLTANQTITHTGDVTGSGTTSIANTVVQLQGRPLSASLPATGNLMGWNGTTWGPVAAGAAAAGGTTTQIQYNNGGVLGGISQNGSGTVVMTTNSTAVVHQNTLGVTGAAATDVALTLNKPASGKSNFIYGQMAASNRWSMNLGNATAEAAGNLGSWFEIKSYDNAGAVIGTPFQIERASGDTYINGNGATPCPADPGPFGGAYLTLNKKSGTGLNAAIGGSKDGLYRWQVAMGEGTAETGSNAGSNFGIYRFSDAGAYLDAPLSISRNTGQTNLFALASGNHTINGPAATDAILSLNKPVATQNSVIYGQKAGAARWGMALGNATAESGSDKGSDFVINNWSDAGAILGSPLFIHRPSGYTYLNGNGATPISTTFETTPYGHSALRLNKAGSGKTCIITGHNNGVIRWNMQLGDTGAESAGAGSDFALGRFDDTGAFIDSPLTIRRLSGSVFFGGHAYIPNNKGLYFNDASGGTINFTCQTDNNFLCYTSNAAGASTPIWGSQTRTNTRIFTVYGTSQATIGFQSTGSAGITVTGVAGTGAPNYSQYVLNANPNFSNISMEAQHYPSVWAGWRIWPGTSFDFRNDGSAVAPGTWIDGSDRRVKADIVEIGGALDKVSKLTGYTYRRTDLSNLDKSPVIHAGLMAQDIYEVLPEAVLIDVTSETAKTFVEGDGPAGFMSYAPSGVVALLVNAVKELTAQNAALAARIEALEARP